MILFLIFYIVPLLFHTIFAIAEYKNKHKKYRILFFDLFFVILPVINFIMMISVLIVFDLNELLDSFIYEEDAR